MGNKDRSTKNTARFLSMKTFAIGAVLATAGVAFIAAEMTGSTELWRLALNAQLQTQKRCRMDELMESRSFELAGVQVIEGRVRCTDGREFTFKRDKPHLKFEFKACAPAVC